MKRTLLLLSTIAVVLNLFAGKVEKSDALLAGKNFYYERVNINASVPYNQISVTGDFTVFAGNEPAYYVFNINENDGFIIVSAEDASQPVLGYSFKGRYSEENMSPEFSFWMNGYLEQIAEIRQLQLKSTEEIRSSWTHLLTNDVNQLTVDRTTLDVEPLISSTWNQDFPYNALCPEDEESTGSYGGRVPVGCVATALSQIMYYWRYPAMGQGSHCITPASVYGPQCANFGTTTYDWNGMTSSPPKECYQAALISYHTGVAVDMSYGPTGSGAYIHKIPGAIYNYFKYATGAQYVKKVNYSTSGWETLLKGDLDEGKPIEYAGFGPDGGHAWVCDGYQGSGYYHFNWGWGAAYDGYYYLTNLNPGGSTFTNSQEAVVHIQPDPAYYPANCTGQVAVTTYDYGTIEDGSGPVADYQNNANCSWLIAPDDSIQKVTLHFEMMDTDPNDVITVYDGNSTGATVLGTYSGTTLPANIVSTGPAMLVTFVSNGSTTSKGFKASYDATVIPFCVSNTTLTDVTGDIIDGSDRFQYRNATTCKWKIQPDNAVSITLVINNIDMEEGKDLIEVYNMLNSQKIATFTGTNEGTPVTCPSGKMMVLFKSDSKNRGAGFDASYTTIVGVEDNSPISKLNIFPNPAEDILNVSFTLQTGGNVTMELISASGVKVISKALGFSKGEVSHQLKVNSLASGIYFLRVISEGGISTSRVVIK